MVIGIFIRVVFLLIFIVCIVISWFEMIEIKVVSGVWGMICSCVVLSGWYMFLFNVSFNVFGVLLILVGVY